MFITDFDGMPQLHKGDKYIGIDFYKYNAFPYILTLNNGSWQTQPLK